MDYFALDKNDQLNKEKKNDTGYEEVCALQNEQIHTRAEDIQLMRLYSMCRKLKRKKCEQNQINNRKMHAEKTEIF